MAHEADAKLDVSYSSDLDMKSEAESSDTHEHAAGAHRAADPSTWSDVPNDPFAGPPDSTVDPYSTNFAARDWIKSFIKLKATESRIATKSSPLVFKNLNVYGYGQAGLAQSTVSNVWTHLLQRLLSSKERRRTHILRDIEGYVRDGELLLVLGPPGSGCSTFLKSITGETRGLGVDPSSYLYHDGGQAIYTAEADVHFPMLTVADTLYFAARARTPAIRPSGASSREWAIHLRDAVMATLGISHVLQTRVGSEYIRGCSGGERKRVSIAEAYLSVAPFGGASLHAWDNSTRGLDSINAIEFCRAIRLTTELAGTTAAVSMYQAPEDAYTCADKVLLLYEGRQIYFGPAASARSYFEAMGFVCPEQETTAEFLTSMASPQQRKSTIKPGYEDKVPRTSDEFEKAWKSSAQRSMLLLEAQEHEQNVQPQTLANVASPHDLSWAMQVRLCLWRGFRRAMADPSVQVVQLIGNTTMAIILGTVFFDLPATAESFFQRSAVIFFSVLVNAFASTLEMLTLFAQRPIVEKQARSYSLYRAAAEACASMVVDLPWKVANAIIFNTTLYFMVHFRREAGAFFFFMLVNFLLTLTMSMLFRTIASTSPSLPQAMAPAGIVVTALVIFTGFAIPINYMLGWCRWINYIDPIAYGYEALMINEFDGQEYPCDLFVPAYGSLQDKSMVCASAVGAQPGEKLVSGAAYIGSLYSYTADHKWRNVGIIVAFMVFLLGTYLVAAEFIREPKAAGEFAVFRHSQKGRANDVESTSVHDNFASDDAEKKAVTRSVGHATSTILWRDVCYDIYVKQHPRRLLNHVDGWAKPGSITALMGASGTGKTTLLDVLASRVRIGIVSGDILVNGQSRTRAFPRKLGYAQQQDFHLHTSTVREAIEFSAILRQPSHVPRTETVAYAQHVINLLEMGGYADAVVGLPGDGLNIEQRKRLTIAVELAAKPELLFIDEPTSGLDSATSWAILDLLEKLKESGQAIVCTIHQPSALLFKRFDRLLLLRSAGQTVYFGPLGPDARTMVEYFERNDPKQKLSPKANPAEWMLQVIGAAPGCSTEVDWSKTWRDSPEYEAMRHELEHIQRSQAMPSPDGHEQGNAEFAAPLTTQAVEVSKRVFAQYWRTPSYIYAKAVLSIGIALLIGLVFLNAPLTHQGVINQEFALFVLSTIFGQLIQQTMPLYCLGRSLFEARERPSRTYSWKAFIFANIFVELPWNALMGVFIYLVFWYPVGLYRNAGGEVHLRSFQFFLYVLQFMLFTSTFCNMVIAGVPSPEIGGNIANLLFILSLVFCGVIQPYQALPRFWKFMYRVTPLTYFIGGMLSTALANTSTYCAENEFVHFDAPAGQTCGAYANPFVKIFGGYLENPEASTDCHYCIYDSTNLYLRTVSVSYSDAWRNFGLIWAFIAFNVIVAVFTYWLARVPKGTRSGKQNRLQTALSENFYYLRFMHVWRLFWHDG